MASPNYFTCTLDQAALLKKQVVGSHSSFRTVLRLVEEQAGRLPGAPALGFADYTSTQSAYEPPTQVTFSELRDLSRVSAEYLSQVLNPFPEDDGPPTIGLLSSSSLDFMLTLLGLMRLGCRAFLLAPQLSPQAIEHLCASSGMRTILVDEAREKTTNRIPDDVNVVKIPRYRGIHTSNGNICDKHSLDTNELDVVYIRHTSGTSSGLPKPIFQTQWGAVGCLPSFLHESQPATYTTTPLYHGGLADCFRAWTSGAMIWCFPEGVAPITATNIIRSLAYAHNQSSAPVKYFSSVPYVLQLLAEEHEGINALRSMDLVGVGGAALAPSIGDELVKIGINLVSRMGSAECGFLMSSNREYAKDKEWQYLRSGGDTRFLSFEPRGEGLSELVVKQDWPLITKTNHDDGSYATADLFEAHPSIPNAWRYHSRADAQITLANGKKFDPTPLEDTVRASTSLLQDVLIFGTGREYAGALLFKASAEISSDDVIEAVWPAVKMNGATQHHSRLVRSMLIVTESRGDGDPLPKSSKGTILRRTAENMYSDVINEAYSENPTASADAPSISDQDLPSVLPRLFFQILGREIDSNLDLFQQGVDSIACIQIKKLIESTIFPEGATPLPLNIIYDNGNMNKLAKSLIYIRKGDSLYNSSSDASEWKLMHEFVDKYGHFEASCSTTSKKDGEVVVLTGATGMLGSHILSTLLGNTNVRKVYCLLRGQTEHACRERVSKALLNRQLLGLEDGSKLGSSNNKVVCFPCQLSEAHLGMSNEDWSRIVIETTVFIHAAWTVGQFSPFCLISSRMLTLMITSSNFNIGLRSFEKTILGFRNMISASISSRARFFFISSTAAVSSKPCATIAEKVSSDPSQASPLGYSRSKWIGERMCSIAHERLHDSVLKSHDAEISIIRVGQLCGNEAGVWNASEAYPLILSTAGFLGCLPDLPTETANWLPVDQAAKIVSEIVFPERDPETESPAEMPVYHVLNPHRSPSWSQLLHWLQEMSGSHSFRIVPAEEWLVQLEEALGGSHSEHPSQALLGLWKRRYGREENECHGSNIREPPMFVIDSSSRLSKTMRDIEPLNRIRVGKMWDWIRTNVGIKGI
ncbi:acetyl-CoA synthetase-like protein [Hypomontagnella monticulosa]|nr:acetyl-CoA synthetase-like protein [Hypomontagnella monticulosa]